MAVKDGITVDEIVLLMLQSSQLENVATHTQIKHYSYIINVSDYSKHTSASIHALLQCKLQELASYNSRYLYDNKC